MAGTALVFAALGLAACGTGTGTARTNTAGHHSGAATHPGAGRGATVTIEHFAFMPSTLTVHPGTTVNVVNKDSVTHTLTSDSGAFDTGDIPGGTTAHFTAPMHPGRFPYRCTIHQFMTGTLVVS